MKSRAASVNRREALALMAAGAGPAACAPEGASDGGSGPGGSSDPIWVKDPSPFVRHGTNLETRF